MVSRSGDSIEIARLAESLRGRSPIIGITNEPAGALARAANCCLHIHSMADATVALQTYTGTVLTLMLLGGTARGEFDRVRSEADILIAAMRKLIQTGTETLRQWDSFVAGGLPLHLLGRGPSYGSALEGALLFNETPKANASAMPAGSFRHGPVEAVDSGFRTFVFAPQSRTRDLNLGLARDLCRFGAAVRVIGPAGPDTAGLSLCETPTASEALAPLVEIVPVQFAAFRLAELKGIPIGGLRYTPLVTRNEGTFAN
jgi:glucosamine--fructose-6-phosphate aminotransferase (isomerizing)